MLGPLPWGIISLLLSAPIDHILEFFAIRVP